MGGCGANSQSAGGANGRPQPATRKLRLAPFNHGRLFGDVRVVER